MLDLLDTDLDKELQEAAVMEKDTLALIAETTENAATNLRPAIVAH